MSALVVVPPPPPPPPPPVPVVEVVRDLDRILALSRRSPIDCARGPDGQYAPATRVLVVEETAKYARVGAGLGGRRLSCACRPRVATLHADGRTVFVGRVLPEGELPEPPLVTTVEALARDWSATEADARALREVRQVRPGQSIRLPSADGSSVGHPCMEELNPVQAWALREGAQVEGFLGYLGVGCGKSLVNIVLPLAFSDCRLAAVLIEPSQRQHYRSQYLRAREHFRVPSIVFDNQIGGYTVPGTPPLHVVPYSVLSKTDSSVLLDQHDFDLLLLDECHNVAGESARGRRVRRFVASRIARREADIAAGRPVRSRAVRFFPSSGTFEVKSVRDSRVLGVYALGTGSPMPIDREEGEAWSAVLDPSRSPDRTSSTARALFRAFGAGEDAGDHLGIGALVAGVGPEVRALEGFREWRKNTPGVIVAAASDCNAAIYLTERRAPRVPDAVRRALAGVRETKERPDGEELVDAAKIAECVREVSSGFYYYWAFPGHRCTCGGAQSCDSCRRILNWFARRKAYSRELRGTLEQGLVHLDSPALCENAARRALEFGGVEPGHVRCVDSLRGETRCRKHWPCGGRDHLPAWASEKWAAWAEVEDAVPHEQRVRWIGHDLPEAQDPATHPGYYLARDAAEWARTHRGIVWYQSVALGRKIAELAGLPCHGGGPDAEDRIVGRCPAADNVVERGQRSVIASMDAHTIGRDGLQYMFSEQLVVEVPPGNKTWEQILGRTHRRGQRADVVKAEGYFHYEEARENMRKAVAGAEWVQARASVQKLGLADVDLPWL